MIDLIKLSASEVGIKGVVSNSDKALEIQLNSLTRTADAPIMLLAWDIDTDLEFNSNGVLRNPKSKITALLMKKAYDTSALELEKTAVEMGELFQVFIQNLYSRLIPLSTESGTGIPLSNITYKLVPRHGAGAHSGVLCNWSMISGIKGC